MPRTTKPGPAFDAADLSQIAETIRGLNALDVRPDSPVFVEIVTAGRGDNPTFALIEWVPNVEYDYDGSWMMTGLGNE